MNDLQQALAPKSDQLNADDLIAGSRTLTITRARIASEERQKKIVLNYEGDNGKPYKPCKTMGRAMVMVWGITDEAQMVGKSITVYRDPDVDFGPEKGIGGIRISHMSHIERPATVKLTISQGKKKGFTFKPLETRGGGENRTSDGGGRNQSDSTPQLSDEEKLAQARTWATERIEAYQAVNDADDLASAQAKAERALPRLKREHPKLATEVEDAEAAAKIRIGGGGGSGEPNLSDYENDR